MSARERRFVSVGTKLAGATLLILAAVTAGVFFQLSGSQRAQLLGSKELAVTMLARLFGAGAAAPLTFADVRGAEEQVSLLTANDQVVYGALWSIDGDAPTGVATKVGEVRRSGFADTPAPSWHTDLRIVRGPDWILAETPVTDPSGKAVGIAQVALSLSQENAAILATKRQTLVASLATALGLALVLLALSRTLIVRPMERLAAAAKRLETGESAEIAVESNDEVGRLAQGFDAMSRAIASREERISARNRDLRRVLDNAAEGFLTVDKLGAMSDERSRVLDQWFGAPRKAGSFFDYIEQITPAAAPGICLGWEELLEGVAPVELVFHQMPHRFERDGRYFAVDYRAIGPQEDPEQVLVVIRDVSQEVERERAEQNQREMAAIVRRMMADRAGLEDFFREASSLVSSIETDGARDRAKLLRDVHTLKGNTALFGIDSVAKFCHGLEQRMLDEPEAPTRADRDGLRAHWSAAHAVYTLLGGASRSDNLEIGAEEYRALLRALDLGFDHDSLRAIVDCWRFERAGTRLSRAREQLLWLAHRLGKGELDITIEVSPAGLRLPQARWGRFWAGFTHVLRNAIDHGIETPEERVASGKGTPAHVVLAIRAGSEGVTVSIRDDGRGIDWEKLRARAAELGLPHATRADVEQALYTDGVSSRQVVTETSGRGVGMAALRDAVLAAGGRIRIETEFGRGTVFAFVFPSDMVPRAVSMPPLGPSTGRPSMVVARPSIGPGFP